MAASAAAQGPPPGVDTSVGPPPGVVIPADGPPPSFDFLTPPGTNLAASRAPALLATSILTTILAAGFVAVRIYRTFQIKRFRGDDHLIVLSLIFHLATNAIIWASIRYGEGKHVGAITNAEHRTLALKLSIICQFVGTFAIVFAKVSVGATLLQLKLGRSFDIMVVVCLIIATFGNFFAAIVVLAGCRTRYLFYTGRDLPCVPLDLFPVSTYFRAGGNILVDAVFVFAPMWFLRKIQLTPRDRLAMQVLLSFIFTATVFAIANAVKVRDTLRNGIDMTWNTALILCFQCSEVSFCIMAACLPAIRHMLGKRFPKRWRFWQGTNPHSTSISKSNNRMSWFFRRNDGQPRFLAAHIPSYSSNRNSGESHIMAAKHQNDHRYIPMSIFDREKAIVDEDDEYYTPRHPEPTAKIDSRLSTPFSPTSPTKVEFASEYRNTLRAQDDPTDKWPLHGNDEKPILSAAGHEVEGSSSGSEWTMSAGDHHAQRWSENTGQGVESIVSPMTPVAAAELDARHIAELEAGKRVAELDGRRKGNMRKSEMQNTTFFEEETPGPRTQNGFWGRDRKAT
ncbi:Hypothetical protein D9617_4g001320 [Elsinoe fawcettii]|nr:Hypothetical protein D9617_4g001320 [Elsinoe fawcettii]